MILAIIELIYLNGQVPMFSLTQTTSRQKEILEVVFRNGWDYMRGLLTGGKAGQPQLPPPEILRNIMIDLGPVYVKMGQLLSTRPDVLSPKYIQALSSLQAQVPPVSWTEISPLIRQELGQPIESVFQSINPVAIAAGSIAQTHKGILLNGQVVALKVQRPGIEKIVAQDIALLKGVAELVSLTDFGSEFDFVGLAEEFSTALAAELDFTKEAHNTDQLRQNMSQSRWFAADQLFIPGIYWECTSTKLLVLDWLDGKPLLEATLKIPELGKDAIAVRHETTTLLFRVFFQQLFVDGFFHADPHPGNIFYLDNGKVALLDFGMVGRIDPRTQQTLTEILLAIADLDARRCAQLTIELSDSEQPANLSKLENDYTRLLRKYYNVNLEQTNFSEVFYELLQTARENNLKIPSNLGLYAKAIANLEGVARTFDPQINLLDELKPLTIDLFQSQLFGENPLQALLRTALDLKSLSFQSPRLLELLLERITTENLTWNLSLKDLEPLRRSVDDSANRLSFSIVVGSLIMGAAIISTKAQTSQLSFVSNALFAAASFLGLWLIISILRSGRLR